MKKISTFLLFALYILATSNAFASQFWNDIQGAEAPTKGVQTIIPSQYKLVQIEDNALQGFLFSLHTYSENNQTILLPTPDGKAMLFYIWSTPILAPALQNKFPTIRTFTAIATSNKYITAKIDYTTKGFHALIYDGDNTYLIDPYSNKPDGYYMVYYKKDYQRNTNNLMQCLFDSDNAPHQAGTPIQINGRLPHLTALNFLSGSTRKTYRLALSCTGEYAQAVDGMTPSKSGVLSAMVTTINRVNGIYEREVAVTLQLIANEDDIIYLNPNTDPFTANNDGGTLLDQNQYNTTNVIGDANYDIGHIFSTGGGGIASLGCVCGSTSKAQGVTGSTEPYGDSYDVDYVAHEMGHQFGAEHTFNANTYSCNGNGSKYDAYEPGSASTIMGYAGICGSPNDLQPHSDDYFHANSLLAITDFIENGSWGGAGGTTCGTSSTGSTPISIADINATYYIPYKTPFELTASQASSSNLTDSISYNWEQWNLGDYKKNEDLGDTFTYGPVFRSWNASGQVRTFPKLSKILENTYNYLGERLPKVARSMSFNLTARSISDDAWGTYNIPQGHVILQVVNTGQPFQVTSPNSFINWYGGTTQVVTWDIAQTNTAPISCANVSIYLSVDGGYTYPYTLAENVPNTGSASVNIPNISATQARVKVKGNNNVFFDISNSNFIITPSPIAIDSIFMSASIKIYPNPANEIVYIQTSINKKLQINLYNVIGQKIWHGEMIEKAAINTQPYAPGIYMIQILDPISHQQLSKTITLQ